MKYKNILFDLDGTIIDSQEGIMNCIIYYLKSFGIEVEDREALKQYIGPPLMDTFQNGYGFSKEKAAEATAKYRERYSTIGMYECTAYDGILELLKELRPAGYKVILATSKPGIYAEKILQKLGVHDAFDVIAGSTIDGSRDSKIAVMEYAMAEAGITDVRDCLMVGDRFYDAEAAEALNMDCAGVLYGFGDEEELRDAGAKYIFPEVKDLREFLI